MKIIITDSAPETGAPAVNIIEAPIRVKPDTVLGLAIVSSSLPLNAALQESKLGLSSVLDFALDEYVGLGP